MVQQKQILITGVHTGLGNALTRACLERGNTVFGMSRKPPDGVESSDRFHFYPIDLTDTAGTRETLDQLKNQTDVLDLVILNAGILGPLAELPRTDIEELQRVFELNVLANKVIVDHLLHTFELSQIIGISSGAAQNGSAGWGAYSISKAALNILLRVYANENPGIHFTALAPGLVDTPMMDSILSRKPNPSWAADGRLRAAAAQGGINSALNTANLIMNIAERLTTVPSGEFVDVRALPWEADA